MTVNSLSVSSEAEALAGLVNNNRMTALRTKQVVDAAATVQSGALAAHVANTGNPHSVTKTQVGLANVDNTSDASKPVSTATQTALNDKLSITLSGSATPGVNSTMAFELTSDTSLTIKVKGTDGTVRSVALTLA